MITQNSTINSFKINLSSSTRLETSEKSFLLLFASSATMSYHKSFKENSFLASFIMLLMMKTEEKGGRSHFKSNTRERRHTSHVSEKASFFITRTAETRNSRRKISQLQSLFQHKKLARIASLERPSDACTVTESGFIQSWREMKT